MTKFEDSLNVNKMARIISTNPEFYKQITLVTEGELYKYKRKLYPKSSDNLGAGFSQFLDNNTRNKILNEVKEVLLKKQGVGGKDDYLMADPEMLMEIINKSIKLLKVNYKKSFEQNPGPAVSRVEPKSAGLAKEKGPPPKKTKK